MSEKKNQEVTVPEQRKPAETMADATNIQKNVPPKAVPDKAHPVPVTVPVVTPSPRLTIPAFTKIPPNELYRRLLPAVLFLLTFVTVMTILLIYMDTVALGARQFRLNMSRDYELAGIAQDSAPLVAYVRQLHLARRRWSACWARAAAASWSSCRAARATPPRSTCSWRAAGTGWWCAPPPGTSWRCAAPRGRCTPASARPTIRAR